jgi:hypothetical protein
VNTPAGCEYVLVKSFKGQARPRYARRLCDEPDERTGSFWVGFCVNLPSRSKKVLLRMHREIFLDDPDPGIAVTITPAGVAHAYASPNVLNRLRGTTGPREVLAPGETPAEGQGFYDVDGAWLTFDLLEEAGRNHGRKRGTLGPNGDMPGAESEELGDTAQEIDALDEQGYFAQHVSTGRNSGRPVTGITDPGKIDALWQVMASVTGSVTDYGWALTASRPGRRSRLATSSPATCRCFLTTASTRVHSRRCWAAAHEPWAGSETTGLNRHITPLIREPSQRRTPKT